MQIIPFCTLDTPCPYLSEKSSRLEYLYIENCDFDFNSKLVERGFRRFGCYFQKPICADCNECQSLRIDAKNFKFSKSHRRIFKKNSQTKIRISRPICDLEHILLYKKYHEYMNQKKGWKLYSINHEKYFEVYVEGHENFGVEISYYAENQLICVDLVDFTNDGISSIYCFYDPDFAHLSLGKFSLLKQIEIAKYHNLPWVYLGYYVKNCESLKYKAEYSPFEILQNYAQLNETAIWKA